MANQNNKPRPGGQNPRSALIRQSLLYVVMFGIIMLIIFVFVRPFDNNKSMKKYQFNNTGIYLKDKPSSEAELDQFGGELADILINGEVYRLQTQVYANDRDIHNVSGYFYTIKESDPTKKEKNYFSAVLEPRFYDYFTTIVEHRKDDKGNAYYTPKIYQTLIPSSNSWMSWVIPIGIAVVGFILLSFFISRASRSMKDGMGGGAMKVSSSRAKMETSSKIRFADVAGCDEVKVELIELVDYFVNAAKYTRLGAKLPKGVLLVGPPGTGKTLLAKAVAGEAKVPFFSISGSDFVEMYVGVGASRVRDMFRVAKQNAPCLIFIDEIDAVGRQRGAGLGGGNDEREQTLNQLLVEMDGFEDNSGVIIIAATNRSDVLDPALTRAGRFDRQITVDLPDKEGREAIFKVHARNKIIAKDVDFAQIAGRTTGFSGADIANIINDAAILAVRSNRQFVTTKDIDEAIDRAIAGPAKSNKSMIEREKRVVSYHESGHAIVGLFLPHSDKVQKVTIVPRGRTGGHVLMTPEQDRFLLTKGELLARITGFLAGRTSEEVFFDDISTGASNDIEVATRIATSMVTEYGMSALGPIQYMTPTGSVFLGRDYNNSQKNFSSKIANEIDVEVRAIIEHCHEEARKLILEHREDIELMAETLLKVETLTADQIEYLLKNREMPVIEEHILEESLDDAAPSDSSSSLFQEPSAESLIQKEYPQGFIGLDNEISQKFNASLLAAKMTGTKHIVLLVETVGENVQSFTTKQMNKIGNDYAKGEPFIFLILTLQAIEAMGLTRDEIASQIERELSVDLLIIETTFEAIKAAADKQNR